MPILSKKIKKNINKIMINKKIKKTKPPESYPILSYFILLLKKI
jgi:hypothetical protein